MNYYQKLKSATTIEEIQEIYNEGFENMVKEIEEEFISDGRGQQLVYADGCIDPSLIIADIHLLVYAEFQAEQLSGKKPEELMIESIHASFIEKRLEKLQNEETTNKKLV